MDDFEKEYKALFETSLENIKPDSFFRADNFQKEKWYGELQIYMRIAVCKTDKETVSDMQKALKVLGYRNTEIEKALEKVDIKELSVEDIIRKALVALA